MRPPPGLRAKALLRYLRNVVQRTKAMGVTLRATTLVDRKRSCHTIECRKRELSPRTGVRQHTFAGVRHVRRLLVCPTFTPAAVLATAAPVTEHTVRTAMSMERTSGLATKVSGGVTDTLTSRGGHAEAEARQHSGLLNWRVLLRPSLQCPLWVCSASVMSTLPKRGH